MNMSRPAAGIVTLALVAASLSACGDGAQIAAARLDPAHPVLEVPVRFNVVNTNTSGVPCPSEGLPYVIRGQLVGPQRTLTGAGEKAVSLYLHGFDGTYAANGDAAHWRFQAVPGYDHASEMARAGHVSLVINMLGYDALNRPHGKRDCWGSQADVTHQIISALKSGQYAVEGASPVAFSKVILIGHDIGGAIAEIEAYSYQDIAGLVNLVWADSPQGSQPFILELFTQRALACALGGENAEDGGPAGYVLFDPPPDQFRDLLFHNAEDAVIEAALSMLRRDPCGWVEHVFQVFVLNQVRLGEITVPVLLIYPEHDPVFTREAQERQQELFTGTRDVTTWILPDTGHIPMLERSAPQFRALLSDWLNSRGFVSAASGG